MTGVGRAALITAGAAAATFAVDRALQAGVEHALDDGERASVLGIPIQRRTNDRGIIGSEQGGSTNAVLLGAGAVLALGIAGAGMVFGRNRGAAGVALQVGTGLIAGGMAANLYNRATNARVTDYVPSPLGTLNAADLALAAGIGVSGLAAAAVALR